MWEISSGRPPFTDKIISENLLKIDLIGGHREEPVPDTPNEYLKLYKSCWAPEPNKRPLISQVFSKLVKLGRTMNIQEFQDIKCDNESKNVYLATIIFTKKEKIINNTINTFGLNFIY